MLGSHGNGDALGTWLLLMFAAGIACTGGGLLAVTGRWRSWYRPIESPIRYAPLAGIPFGVGCLIETAATLLPLSVTIRQVVAIGLLVCLLASALLFLRFPARLRPAWIRQVDAAALSSNRTGGDGAVSR